MSATDRNQEAFVSRLEFSKSRAMSFSMQTDSNATARRHKSIAKSISILSTTIEDLPPSRPYVVILMIVMSFITLFASFFLNGGKFESLSDNLSWGPSVATLDKMGAKFTPRIVNEVQIHRLVWPTFLHAGVLHFALNMLVLYQFGPILEREFGSIKIASLLMISGTVGWIFSSIFLVNSLGVGASGAIFGVIGSLFGDALQNHLVLEPKDHRKWMLSLSANVAVALLLGTLPFIDNWAHIGGGISGFFIGCVFLVNERNVPSYSRKLQIGAAISLIVLVLGGLLMLFLLPPGGEFCPACRYINCFETPWWDCKCEARYSNGTMIKVPC